MIVKDAVIGQHISILGSLPTSEVVQGFLRIGADWYLVPLYRITVYQGDTEAKFGLVVFF